MVTCASVAISNVEKYLQLQLEFVMVGVWLFFFFFSIFGSPHCSPTVGMGTEIKPLSSE